MTSDFDFPAWGKEHGLTALAWTLADGTIKGSNIFATGRQWYELAKSLGYFDQGGRPLLKRDGEGKTSAGEMFVVSKSTPRLLKTQDEIDECPEMFREERDGRWYRR